MKKIALFAITLLLLTSTTLLKGQKTVPTETDNHLFWQPNRLLCAKDFRGTGSRFVKHNQYCSQYDMCTMAFVGVFATLDVPKRPHDRGKLLEKVYFVPVFEKTSSYILKKDTAGVKKQQIIFDIYEISARFARKKMKQYQDSLPGYGGAVLMFKTVETDAIEFRNNLIHAYTSDMYIHKTENAYLDWREKIDTLLKNTQKYATTPEDCYRAINKAPFSKKYETPTQFIGDLKSEDR